MAYAWENSKTLNESSATVIRTKDIIKNLYDQLSTKEEFKNVSFDTFIALYNYYKSIIMKLFKLHCSMQIL